jgi:hypothetical protein
MEQFKLIGIILILVSLSDVVIGVILTKYVVAPEKKMAAILVISTGSAVTLLLGFAFLLRLFG